MCGLRFYADWRMHIVFAEHNEIVVAWVGQHTDQENPHVDGATDVPQLADVGRRTTATLLQAPRTNARYGERQQQL